MQQTDVEQAQKTLSLKRFPIKDMPDNATCVMAAMSSGGKTTLGLELLWYKRHLPAWYLFSESEGCSSRLSQTIPKLYTFPSVNLKKLEAIYNYQERKIAKYTRPRTEAERRAIPDDELPLEERFYKNPCVGGYFEDCFGEKKVFLQKAVQNLFKNGRHRCMFSIIPCQYIIDLPPSCRKQVKYWFLLREDNKDVRKKLWEQIGNVCGKFEVFEHIMDYCTRDYGCVVIDNISKSNKIEDRVFWYRAEKNRPAFKVGCKNYWEFSKKNLLKTTDICTPEEEEAMRKLEAARMAKKMGVTKHQTVPPTKLNGKTNPMSLLNTASMLTAAQTGFQHMSKGKVDQEPFKIELL